MFENTNYILQQGDCIPLMADISDQSIDCIITDLPYGQTKNNWDIVIPFNDYIIVKIKNKEKILYQNEFLLWCYQNNKANYKTALAFFKENKRTGLWTHYERIIKDNGAIILFGNGMFTADLMESNRKMWRYNLIWEKTQPTGFQNANRMPMRNHEDMCVFYKKLPTYHPQKTGGHIRKVSTAAHKRNCRQSTNYNVIKNYTYDSTERFPRSIWTFSKDIQKSALTPTQKPLALIEELIKTYTDEGDCILDSCMGSNTTGKACQNLNRRFIGIEKDKDTFQIAERRMLSG